MASRHAYAAIQTAIFGQLIPIRGEIDRREFAPDLANGITLIARDLEAILALSGDATPERRARLGKIAKELQAGAAIAVGNPYDA